MVELKQLFHDSAFDESPEDIGHPNDRTIRPQYPSSSWSFLWFFRCPTTNADRDSLDSAQTAIDLRTLDDTLLLVAISYRFGAVTGFQIILMNATAKFRNGFSLATTAILGSDARISSAGSLFKKMLKLDC
jgi:hypothetical protein